MGVINSLRFTLKSLGYAIANPSTERFHKVIQEQVPESVGSVIAPSVQALKELYLRIKLLDREKPHYVASGQLFGDCLAQADPRSGTNHCALLCLEIKRSGPL